jgi:nitrous oxide reductase
MEWIMTIKDQGKATHILSLLKKYSYVKIKPIKTEKEQLIADLKEAVEEMKLIKAGKKKGKLLSKFLDEL